LTEAPGNALRYPVRTRILHWLSAVLIFSGLFVGFVMVNSIGSYRTLVGLHMTLGVTILTIVVVRIANRSTQRAVTLPDTVGRFEHKLVVGSELGLYILMLAQPLVGWAMVSASGRPVIVFGAVRLPPIAPLRQSVLRTPSDAFHPRVRVGRCDRRARECGAAAHAHTPGPHAVPDDVR